MNPRTAPSLLLLQLHLLAYHMLQSGFLGCAWLYLKIIGHIKLLVNHGKYMKNVV